MARIPLFIYTKPLISHGSVVLNLRLPLLLPIPLPRIRAIVHSIQSFAGIEVDDHGVILPISLTDCTGNRVRFETILVEWGMSKARKARTKAANDVLDQMITFANERGFEVQVFEDWHWRFIGYGRRLDWYTGTGKVLSPPGEHNGAYAMSPRSMAKQLLEVRAGRPLARVDADQMTMW
jgi:hypothetical protein